MSVASARVGRGASYMHSLLGNGAHPKCRLISSIWAKNECIIFAANKFATLSMVQFGPAWQLSWHPRTSQETDAAVP